MTHRPIPSSSAVAARMSAQKRVGTGPELEIRGLLHAMGFRYKVDAPLPGLPRRRADLLFTRRRVAVFIDGCFWHSCPIHATRPKANAEWWESKLIANVARDRSTDAHLANLGWRSLRYWEHQDPTDVVRHLAEVLRCREQTRKPTAEQLGGLNDLPQGQFPESSIGQCHPVKGTDRLLPTETMQARTPRDPD